MDFHPFSFVLLVASVHEVDKNSGFGHKNVKND
jgi:hypothetical protein